MMGEMIFRNLLHRPIRTIIGILAIGVEVALVVLVVGLVGVFVLAELMPGERVAWRGGGQRLVNGKTVRKVVVVPKKLVNIVI